VIERLIDLEAPQMRLMIQGATGRAASRNIGRMRAHGTPIVAGVSARGAGTVLEGVPLFATAAEAVAETGAEASLLMVPPLAVLPAAREALDAKIRLLVTVTEGIPVHDTLRLRDVVRAAGATWIGASSPGLAVPGRCKIGFLPDACIRPGPIAIWSKSGTLSYETGRRLKARGLGQSAWIGVGGDSVKGTRFADLVEPFRTHAPTRAVVVVGEIGGTEEEELADALRANPIGKPVYAILAGASAPEGRQMGHAGAIVAGGRGSFASKAEALRAAGVAVFSSIAPMIQQIEAEMAEHAG
jgi:succinyl-CoA synthetase alpha subunit